MKGHHTEETKRKLRLKKLGKHISPMTEFKKGFHYSPKTEFKKGLIPWNKGMKNYKLEKESITKKKLYAEGKIKTWNKGLRGDIRLNRYWLGKKRPLLSEKMKMKMKGKYKGKDNPFYGKKHTPETMDKFRKRRAKQIFPIKDTKIEVKIQTFLQQLGIEYFAHQYMNIEHSYQCDIFIPSMKFVIECDGDYWHKYPTGKEIDHIRTKELLDKGFKVLRLWEREIKVLDIDKFKKYLNIENEETIWNR